jgi:hypothetical protein
MPEGNKERPPILPTKKRQRLQNEFANFNSLPTLPYEIKGAHQQASFGHNEGN